LRKKLKKKHEEGDEMKKKTITRRDFLRAAAVAPLAGALACAAHGVPPSKADLLTDVPYSPIPPGENVYPHPWQKAAALKSRVVLVRDQNAVTDDRKFNAEVIQKMLDDAMAALFDEKDPVAAWKKIVKPTDIVGIKTNSWRFLPTSREVEQAIKRRVMDAGVPEEKIAIADSGVLNNPIFKEATALINARPARCHYWAGMGSCIKNYIQFVPNRPDYHPDACADLASIWSLPPVKDRTRLNILVMLTPLFHNIGPQGFSEKYLWPYKGLIVGQDVVAVDTSGLNIMKAKRLQFFGEERPFETSAHHIALADTKHKLGTSDPAKIELIKLGWKDDILI
jgi:hypothetical protein